MYQERFWRELDQLKVHVYYLERYLEKTVSIDRNINMFLALTSNASIAGWVIWQEYSFFWGTAIAISQAINAIKTFLPYSKRLKSLQGLTNDLESLFLSMESKWFDVSEGALTEEQIHKLHMGYKEKRRQLIQKYLGTTPLPENKKMMDKAKKSAQCYFQNFYVF
ncbi:hypothetical protein CTN03_03555 [Photobacterium angustum]|nr:hypothetical protein UB39_14010 [Photobacterium angustum]PSW82257.1 hypothetical protein CTN03_03555 [Photobacterium angustum]